MTARAIGVFVLVLAMASPALAGPENSTIGGKRLEQDMVHSAGIGYPVILYEWWNKGPGSLDWGLGGDLAYGTWPTSLRRGDFIKIGLGVNGTLRWHLATKERPKVTNDVGLLVRPGILLARNAATTFTFGIRAEVGAPVSIDVHERVSVVVGGFIPFEWNINSDFGNSGVIPLLVRMGVEIDANENLAPWFYFDLGPGIGVGGGTSGATFAWRIGAGLA
ncbi:MAG: hypothetical protein OEM16_18680, partial [Myxococcales bacterium]|nr:hypothetical protein [Myxococcales bacterium]